MSVDVLFEQRPDGTVEVCDRGNGRSWVFDPRKFDTDAAVTFLKANRKRFGMARHFRFDHLPPALRFISEQFACLAAFTIAVSASDPAECAAALRKLKEAKDCAVSAAVPPAEGWA